MGYPVIDVYRDEKDKETAVVTQEHFVTDVKDEGGIVDTPSASYI